MKPGQLHDTLQRKCGEIRKYLIRLGAAAPDAEDIVQDTLYKAFLYIEAIDENKFSAWMYKVAINAYYDLCRRRKRFAYPAEMPEPAAPDREGPEEQLLRREKRSEVERVLEQLKPSHRQLLILKYELELSYREMAGMLGITEQEVKAALYRARQQFKTKYHDE